MGLDGVEIVMEVESKFNVVLPTKEVENCQTVGELGRFVLLATADAELTEEETLRRIRGIVAEQMGIPVEDIRPESTWRSLGID